jgi:hypothetical protein
VLYNAITATTPSQCRKGKIMNKLTKDIMAWLKVDADTAVKVQDEMMCSGISFSNSSTAALKRCAKECLAAIKGQA